MNRRIVVFDAIRAMYGLEHLRNAERVLHNGSSDPREAVRAAAYEFWNAVFYAREWPETLRHAAESVYPHILWRGTIDRTLGALDACALQDARHKILEFCALAERTVGEERSSAEPAAPPAA